MRECAEWGWEDGAGEAEGAAGFVEFVVEAAVDAEEGFGRGWRGEGVGRDVGVWGTQAGEAAEALFDAGGGPGEVEVDDGGGVLEVDAFAEEVGGEEEVDAVGL